MACWGRSLLFTITVWITGNMLPAGAALPGPPAVSSCSIVWCVARLGRAWKRGKPACTQEVRVRFALRAQKSPSRSGITCEVRISVVTRRRLATPHSRSRTLRRRSGPGCATQCRPCPRWRRWRGGRAASQVPPLTIRDLEQVLAFRVYTSEDLAKSLNKAELVLRGGASQVAVEGSVFVRVSGTEEVPFQDLQPRPP